MRGSQVAIQTPAGRRVAMITEKTPSHRITWDDSWAIGIPAIDEQHELLCVLANRLLDQPDAMAHDEHVVDILTDLGRFLIQHFHTEEALMRRIDNMPADELERHIQAHNRIIDQYASLNLAAAQRLHTAQDVFRQVKEWVSDHFDSCDAKIRDFLAA